MKRSDIRGSASFRRLNPIIENDNGKQTGDMPKLFFVQCEPMGAPRMNRSDKWLKRPVVQRYFMYRDIIRRHVSQVCCGMIPDVPIEVDLVFNIAMPDSWSEKKKKEMNSHPHRNRPDVDNLAKAVLDSLFTEDGGIATIRASKRWVRKGLLEGVRIELFYQASPQIESRL